MKYQNAINSISNTFMEIDEFFRTIQEMEKETRVIKIVNYLLGSSVKVEYIVEKMILIPCEAVRCGLSWLSV